MGGRIAWVAIVVGLAGCARRNPAYEASRNSATSSGSASGAGDRGVADATTRGEATRGIATTSDSSVGPGSQTESSVTSATGSGSDETTSVTATDTSLEPFNLLWVSATVMGDWDSLDDEPCGTALLDQAVCLNAPLVIIGRAGAPVDELPQRFEFLEAGPFYSAITGELVLVDFYDLLVGVVETSFVEALTPAGPSTELYVWRGPLDADPALTCEDWSNPAENGSLYLFEAGSSAVSIAGQAPCVSTLRLLCTCAAAP